MPLEQTRSENRSAAGPTAEQTSSPFLPPELRRFLELPGPQSIVIRGRPGTGKTSLALALLEAFPGVKTLVSGRVSRLQLQSDFPWIQAAGLRALNLVDATTAVGDVRATAHVIAYARNLLTEEERRESAKVQWLPGQVQLAWNELPKDTPAIVVIDSWDALVEQYLAPTGPGEEELPTRSELEHVLFGLLARTEAHLVLVLERDEPTQLEYLANAAVHLERIARDERWERWLTLEKLRGIRIESGSYPYTLEGGRFRCSPAIPNDFRLTYCRWEEDPSPVPGQLWPGSTRFVEIFGRMPESRISVLELDHEIHDEAFRMLTVPVVGYAVAHGSHALLVPPPGMPVSRVWTPFRSTISPRDFGRRVSVAVTEPASERQVPREVASAVIDFSRGKRAQRHPEARLAAVQRRLSQRAASGIPHVFLLSAAGFRALDHARGLDSAPDGTVARIRSFTGGVPVHAILFGRSEHSTVQGLTEMAAIHLRLRDRLGRVVVQGVRPRTSGHLLTTAPEPHPYELIPIV